VSYGCLLFIFVIAAIIYGIKWAWSGVKSVLGFPTPTLYISDCYRWEEINYSMVGKYECVYGTVVSMLNDATPSSTVINFSNQSGNFYLIDTESYYPDLTIGTCVQAKEYVYPDENLTLHMNITKLYECESGTNPARQQTATWIPTSTFRPTQTIAYRPVTWMELAKFLDKDRPTTLAKKYDPIHYTCLDFSVDLVEEAGRQNIKAWIVDVDFSNGEPSHAYVAFETTDYGIFYIEPQTDTPYWKPKVGEPLCSSWDDFECMGIVSSFEYIQCDHSHNCTEYTP
jgi:hypothetical protein